MQSLRLAALAAIAIALAPLSGCYAGMYSRPGFGPHYGPGYYRSAPTYAQPGYSQPVYTQPGYSQPVYSQPGVTVVQHAPEYSAQPGVTVIQTQRYQPHWIEGHYVMDGSGNNLWVQAHWE
jgi:hypothetical protein